MLDLRHDLQLTPLLIQPNSSHYGGDVEAMKQYQYIFPHLPEQPMKKLYLSLSCILQMLSLLEIKGFQASLNKQEQTNHNPV